jgi:hypothetical protein
VSRRCGDATPSSPPTGSWAISPRLLNKDGLEIAQSRASVRRSWVRLLARIVDDTISGKIAKEVFEAMWADGQSADAIIEARGLKQITDTGAIEKVIDEVIAKPTPKQLADYRSGKDKLFGFFVGQVMKASKGKANPAAQREPSLLSETSSGQTSVFAAFCNSSLPRAFRRIITSSRKPIAACCRTLSSVFWNILWKRAMTSTCATSMAAPFWIMSQSTDALWNMPDCWSRRVRCALPAR